LDGVIYAKAAVAVVALAAGMSAGWTARGWIEGRKAAEVQAHVATLREQAMHDALIELARRNQSNEQAARQARTKSARDAAAAAAADATAAGMRDYIAELAARAAACDSATAGGGEATDRPGDLLADMLRGLEAAGRAMAAEADRRGTAGAACEASYDGLTK
jgi:hypothetical protein